MREVTESQTIERANKLLDNDEEEEEQSNGVGMETLIENHQ